MSTASTAAGGASAFTSDADDETGDVDVDEDGPPELEEDIDDVRVEAVTARLRDVRC